jgi:hypothetical protein
MTKQEFINWAKSKGWKEDKFGHLRTQKGKHRFKISSIAARYEKQITFSDGKHEWLRIMSGYYKDLSINSDGKLSGMKR